MPVPIRETAAGIDLSARVFTTTTVAASPSGSTETIIATITTAGDIAALAGVLLIANAAFTMGTSGVSGNLRIRRTDANGTVIAATGATTAAATNLVERTVVGFDTGPTLPGQVYVVTLTIASGAAASTVSAVTGVALVV